MFILTTSVLLLRMVMFVPHLTGISNNNSYHFQLRDSVCHNCLRNLHIPMRNDRNTSANSPMSGATRPYNRAPKVPVSEIVGNRHHFCIPENQSTWKIVKKPKKLLLFLTYASSCTPFLKYLYPVSHWQISKWYITCLF